VIVVVATFLIDLLIPALGLPNDVRQIALTAHLGQPMIGVWDWAGVAACLVLTFGGLMIGGWGFAHARWDANSFVWVCGKGAGPAGSPTGHEKPPGDGQVGRACHAEQAAPSATPMPTLMLVRIADFERVPARRAGRRSTGRCHPAGNRAPGRSSPGW
jgi:hypothetical protein